MTRRMQPRDWWDTLALGIGVSLLVGGTFLALALVAALIAVFRTGAAALGWRL